MLPRCKGRYLYSLLQRQNPTLLAFRDFVNLSRLLHDNLRCTTHPLYNTPSLLTSYRPTELPPQLLGLILLNLLLMLLLLNHALLTTLPP
jgi:hypothetical protein